MIDITYSVCTVSPSASQNVLYAKYRGMTEEQVLLKRQVGDADMVSVKRVQRGRNPAGEAAGEM
eukprot:gene2281-48066_t